MKDNGRVTQYAQIEGPTGIPRLVDIVEYGCLTELNIEEMEEIADEPANEAGFIWKVAYGCFMPQPDRTLEDALGEFEAARRCAFGRIVSGRPLFCRLAEVRDFMTFEPFAYGKVSFCPVAVLIGTLDEIPLVEKNALTLFPRYFDMNPMTNIINRPYVLAVKGEETSARQALAADLAGTDWRQFVSSTRAAAVAVKCE